MSVKVKGQNPKWKVSIFTILLMMLVGILVRTALRPEFDPDLSWHLNLAQSWLQKSFSPFVDHFSFTFEGHSMRNPYVLFELATYSFYSLFGGMLGIQIFKFLNWILILFTFLYFCHRNRVHWIITLGAANLLVYSLCEKFVIRPDTLAPFYFFWLLTIRGALNEKYNYRTIIYSYLLLAFWTNWHSTSVYGYMLTAGFMVDQFFASTKNKSFRGRLLFLDIALWVVSGLLNLDFIHPVFPFLTFQANQWGSYIGELAQTDVSNLPTITMASMVLLTGCVFFYFSKKRYMTTAVVGIFIYQAYKVARMPIIIISLWLPVVTLMMQQLFEMYLRKEIKQSILRFATVGLFVFSISILYVNLNLAQAQKISIERNESIYPVQFLTEIKPQLRHGNIFNEYSLGSFIPFYFPDLKIYIDGRTNILYPISHMEEYSRSAHDLNSFFELLKKYRIDYLIAPQSGMSSIDQFALKSRQFSVINFNNAFIYFGRGPNYLNAATLLLDRPWCLSEVTAEYIRKDLDKLEGILDKDNKLSDIYRLLLKYKTEKPKDIVAFVLNNRDLIGKNDILRRVFSYESKAQNENSLSMELINGVSQPNAFDVIQTMEVAFRINLPHVADASLQRLKLVLSLQPWETVPLNAQLEKLRKLRKIEFISEDDQKRLQSLAEIGKSMGFKKEIVCK
jgi:hypothetical protein